MGGAGFGQVPVCRSQQSRPPNEEALPRHPFGLGDSGGASVVCMDACLSPLIWTHLFIDK